MGHYIILEKMSIHNLGTLLFINVIRMIKIISETILIYICSQLYIVTILCMYVMICIYYTLSAIKQSRVSWIVCCSVLIRQIFIRIFNHIKLKLKIIYKTNRYQVFAHTQYVLFIIQYQIKSIKNNDVSAHFKNPLNLSTHYSLYTII